MKPLQSNFPDAAVTVDLDVAFLGVNERDDPAALQTEQGSYVTAAQNMRFRTRRPDLYGPITSEPGPSYLMGR